MNTATIHWRDLLRQVRLLPLAALFTALPLSAQIPSLINYQGRLTDGSGNPVTGNRTMAVRIYDAPSGGNMTYEENIGTVAVTNGTYSFQFGDEGDGIIAVLIGLSDYLALSVNGTEETTRTRLLAVPYALKAKESSDTTALRAELQALGVLPPPTPTPTPPTDPISDTTPPQLVSLTISPGQVDVGSSSAKVAVTARITDNLAGYEGGGTFLRFTSPSGNQFVDAWFSSELRQSGTATDGTYLSEMTIPRFAESGQWTVTWFILTDAVGNMMSKSGIEAGVYLDSLGFPKSFVVSGVSDTTPPQLVSLTISPGQVDVGSSSAKVAVTARITDNLAGYEGGGTFLRFTSPSGNQFVDAWFSSELRQSGTATDGTYLSEMTIPRFAESGQWTVTWFILTDAVGNMMSKSGIEAGVYLDSLGFPKSFVVSDF